MKIECLRDKLQIAVANAERISSKNQNLPILSCVSLEADLNFLKIRATNLDIGIEIQLPVKIENKGNLIIPATVLNSFISNTTTDKNINLEEKEGSLLIYNNKNSATIKSFPKDDFPSIPRLENGTSFKIEAKELSLGLKSVWYSASTSSIKQELSSVYMYADKNELIFVSTDSFRLAEKRIKIQDLDENISVIIPFKNIPEIIKIFDQVNGQITVCFDKNQITFEYEGIYIVSRLINGSFPDYKQIIPKSTMAEAIVLKQDLINALKLSNIFSDKFNQVSLDISLDDNKLTISTKNADIGENKSKISGVFSGEDNHSNFNQKYISDSFQSIYSDSIILSFNGPQKPLIVRGQNDTSFLYLVMPMNR